MKRIEATVLLEQYDTAAELSPADRGLLDAARGASASAYAPYSQFFVGAAALLDNGEIVTGFNQENASFPAGVCAERTTLSASQARYPDSAVIALAVSYRNMRSGLSNEPISPCGLCRQTLVEFETRSQRPIRLILGGLEGKVLVVPQSSDLLPLSFTKSSL